MKKVLIYLYREKLAPKGGPYGYAYNLEDGLKKNEMHEDLEIHFIEKTTENKLGNSVKNIKNNKIKKMLDVFRNLYKKSKILYGRQHNADVNLNDYDAVHFHSTRMMYEVRDSLKDYRGIVILTSHSPTLLSNEIFDSLSKFEQTYLGWFYKKLIRMDEFSFNRADYLIFPCEEAEEPYYHMWNKYKEIHDLKKGRFKYFPTGTLPKKVKLTNDEVRYKYNIPSNAFVVSYVGRHNEIKGYSDLKKIGEMLLNQRENVYFLIAGKEEPLQGLNHPHWIEVGWTNDPGSIVAAADIFILPNRETYFDLVMLEVLSLGQIVLASKTGGNNYFKKYDKSGIMLYDGNEEAEKIILNLMSYTPEKMQEMRDVNRHIYETDFTTEVFAKRYTELISSILEKEEPSE